MMATAFAHAANNNPYTMAQRTTPSPPQSYYPGNASPQTPPSANQSPTSYHAHLHVRQLRPQKQPLYTPACLRPTESSRPKDIPGPRAPDTPPTSNHSSFDNGNIGLDLPATSNMSSQESEFDLLRQGLSRVASDTIDEEFGEVTGPPTMAHWKPNESADACAICQSNFTWYFRKHHCRRCGDVVCAPHLTKTVPLDQNARYNPNGTESKACDACFRAWRTIKKLRHSRTSSLANSMTSSFSNGTAKPGMLIPQHVKNDPSMFVGSMARSEGGMVWSTF
ncbi:hypothetical protein MBLNU13_g11236t1 [Cladosporium sp. NU13]